MSAIRQATFCCSTVRANGRRGEECWIGRERKRGKIEELNAFLTGAGRARYSARGPSAADHPLRDHSGCRYACCRRIQGAGWSKPSRIPAIRSQIDPVTQGSHQRLCDHPAARRASRCPAPRRPGSRAPSPTLPGSIPIAARYPTSSKTISTKALSTARPFTTCRRSRPILGDRFPAETLLSHDLIEGAHAGVGLATDIELLENIPLDYSSFSRRQHRWIRGDWQIAPWIVPRVPGPNGADRQSSERHQPLANFRQSSPKPGAGRFAAVAAVRLADFGGAFGVERGGGAGDRDSGAGAAAGPLGAPAGGNGSRQAGRGRRTDALRGADRVSAASGMACRGCDCARLVPASISRRRLLEWQTADAAERERASTSTPRSGRC